MTDKITITIKRDILEHTVVALEYAYNAEDEMVQESIKYLRHALAQKAEPDEQEAALQKIADFGQEQKPVAWIGLPGKGTPLYAAQPAPAAVPPQAMMATDSGLDEFIGDYELTDGEGGYYAPNETERGLIKDAILGFLEQQDAPPAPATVPLTDAAIEVLTERKRQTDSEGWTPEHDDEHDDESMATAAACYALPEHLHKFRKQTDTMSSARGLSDPDDIITYKVPILWPRTWACWWWKPKDRRRNLIRAAALLIAEIERLDRAMIAAAGKATP